MSIALAARIERLVFGVRRAGVNLGIVFACLCAVSVVPVFLVRVAPLSDTVNHLARMYRIAVGDGDQYLSAFYAIEWQILPNLAMDLIMPPLARLFDVYRAGQIFMAGTLILLASGPMAIQYALRRRLGVWPLTVFLILYNQVFLVGLANYFVGVGVAMWGLAAWIMLAERNALLRLAVSAVFVAAIFLCHLSALGLYGLAIGSFSLQRWHAEGRRLDWRILREVAILAVPTLPVVPLLLGTSTWGLAQELEWSPQGKLDALLMIFRTYADGPDLAILVLSGAALAWAVRRGLVSFHPAALVLAVVGGLAFMAMPTILFGSYMADQRIPVALLMMLIGFGSLDERDPAIRYGFLALVLGFSAIRVGGVSVHWMHLARSHEEIRAAVQHVERGAKILVAYADEPIGDTVEQDSLAHAPCVAVIERSALVSTLFSVPGKQILRVREAYRDRVDTEDGTPPNVSALVAEATVDGLRTGHYWDGWEDKHDYVMVLHAAADAPNPDPELLSLVAEGQGFQLYAIQR
ncbi:hypothetical protein [Prosthecomicrobium sp. N25]|uniref:hypothetical protein n=1 Tax=Prosthecomicrobium sp. N25 TaxID=3129254 RepID=UPI00307801F9